MSMQYVQMDALHSVLLSKVQCNLIIAIVLEQKAIVELEAYHLTLRHAVIPPEYGQINALIFGVRLDQLNQCAEHSAEKPRENQFDRPTIAVPLRSALVPLCCRLANYLELTLQTIKCADIYDLINDRTKDLVFLHGPVSVVRAITKLPYFGSNCQLISLTGKPLF